MLVPRRFWIGAEILQVALRNAADEFLAVEFFLAGDLGGEAGGEGVDHRGADAVQAAGGGIGFAGKFAAGMQCGEDDLERGFVLEFGVRVDRDAAAVIADGEPVAGLERHLDERGMAGHCLVHGIVKDFRGEVVQGGLIGAADIHARPAADRL